MNSEDRIGELIDWLLHEPAYTPVDMREKIQALLLTERIKGFKDARIACSFNKGCACCTANKLSLEYLGKPQLTQQLKGGGA